jgi:peptide/nickel transport system ATP-binding protein
MTALLEIEDLRVTVGGHRAVAGVSFAMGPRAVTRGERLGIVGESGAGKSMLARAILRLLPPGAAMSATRLAFDGVDLAATGEAAMRRLRGRRIALVLQDPRFSLNPAMRIGDQIAEGLRAHAGLSGAAARDRALALIEAVRLGEPETIYRRYPHQLSGGMGQRAMIAMMLAPDPELLIADEPTSALDASVAAGILALLDAEATRRGMAVILISHDLDLVASFCDRVLVMKDGVIVEALPAARLGEARDPYTRALMAARLKLEA